MLKLDWKTLLDWYKVALLSKLYISVKELTIAGNVKLLTEWLRGGGVARTINTKNESLIYILERFCAEKKKKTYKIQFKV